jgi:hypothetical protein
MSFFKKLTDKLENFGIGDDKKDDRPEECTFWPPLFALFPNIATPDNPA